MNNENITNGLGVGAEMAELDETIRQICEAEGYDFDEVIRISEEMEEEEDFIPPREAMLDIISLYGSIYRTANTEADKADWEKALVFAVKKYAPML